MVSSVLITGDLASAIALQEKIAQHTSAPIAHVPMGTAVYLVTLVGASTDTAALKTLLTPLTPAPIAQVGVLAASTTTPTTPTPDNNPTTPTVTITRIGYTRSGTTLDILAQANGSVTMKLTGRSGTVWADTSDTAADTGTYTEGTQSYNKRRRYTNVPDGLYTISVSIVGSEAAPTTQNITLAAAPVITPTLGIGYKWDSNTKSLEVFALAPDTSNYYVVLTAVSGSSWTGTSARLMAPGTNVYFGVNYNRRWQYIPGFVAGGVDVPFGQYSLRVYREGDTSGGTTVTLTLASQNAEDILSNASSGSGGAGSGQVINPGADDASSDDETGGSFDS